MDEPPVKLGLGKGQLGAGAPVRFMGKAERERAKRRREEAAATTAVVAATVAVGTTPAAPTAAAKRARTAPETVPEDEFVVMPDETVVESDPYPTSHSLLHWLEKPLADMTSRDWRIFREDFQLTIQNGGNNTPLRSWEESDIPPLLLAAIRSAGFTQPTPIQRATIPIALAVPPRDVVGIARTGSGKTAAFAIPMIAAVLRAPARVPAAPTPLALVLAPTRELAQQIESDTALLAALLGLAVVSIVGGHLFEDISHRLRNGADIVVATPGRLVDCIERHLLVLARCSFVVMDEADRMLDLGFEDQLGHVLKQIPAPSRQTLMFTATMPPSVEKLARQYLHDTLPATVTVGTAGLAAESVEQRVERVEGEEARVQRMLRVIRADKTPWAFAPPIIVFVNHRRQCDVVAQALSRYGVRCTVMHGLRLQEQREQLLAELRLGSAAVLVATDVAGRGIDVPNVLLVVNFLMSKLIDAYTHRIGRTGRAGARGVALTFVGEEDADVLDDLRAAVEQSKASVVPEWLRRRKDANGSIH